MRKFFILIQKEIRELLTPQMLVPFVLVIVVLYFFGQFANKQAQKVQGPQQIAIIDQDKSILSRNIIDLLGKSNFQTKIYSDSQDLPTSMRQDKVILGLVIPDGFEASVVNFQPKNIETYALLNSFSALGASKYANLDKAVMIVNDYVSNNYITSKFLSIDPTLLKSPIKTTPVTIVDNKSAQISANLVLGEIAKQASVVPIILFLVTILASTMIATSIASEKENKTLETLLTAPLNRKTVITAKMVGAGVVGLLLAGTYLLGFRSFISNGAMANIGGGDNSSALNSLGLVLSPQSYLLMGLVIFLGILVALSIAIILGSFAEDVKGVQGTIAPLMVLMLIPYLAVLLIDINALPTAIRTFLYAIPFTHVFLAMTNLFLHNYQVVLYGAIYLFVLVVVFVWIAAWIFSTDKIVTMRLNFSKKLKI